MKVFVDTAGSLLFVNSFVRFLMGWVVQEDINVQGVY